MTTENKVTIQVNQRPVSISYECTECEAEISLDYSDFEDQVGEYCDWCYTKIKCAECGCELEIEGSEWD